MAWIEFHPAKIKRLKKFIDFRRNLQWNTNETLGFLGSFWGEAIEIRESGDISDWTPDYLCELTNVSLNPSRVWEALVFHRWIDMDINGRVLIHDWLDTAARYLETKYRTSNPERLVDIWALHGRLYNKSGFSQSKVGPPNLTLPNLTLPNLTKDKTPLYPPLGEPIVNQKKKGPKKDPISNWALLIDHIKRKWEYKKRPNGRFSPTEKDFSQLRKKAMVYDVFELMGLYDDFIVNDDPFYVRNGHVIWVFCRAIDTLVDGRSWKGKAQKYRDDFFKPVTSQEVDNQKKVTEAISAVADLLAKKVP